MQAPEMPEEVRDAAYRAEPTRSLDAALDYAWRAGYDAGHSDGYGRGRDDEAAGLDLPVTP